MASRPYASILAASLLAVTATGCESVGTAVQAVDETLYKAVPLHPVTGKPMPNLVSEEQEIQTAAATHEQLSAAASNQNVPFDPLGPQSDQLQRVFARLVAVAHRQQLPWQVHLIGHPEVNALTPGGGYVYVLAGLSGKEGLVRAGDDEELAAVLAHEISHVTLMHVSIALTDQMLSGRAQDDEYYRASFTTDQEAEADRLSVLYLALAGFDPQAPTRVWARAHEKTGSDPRRSAFLHTHPLNAERFRITKEAATQVATYYEPGRQNPDWRAILDDNPLFRREPDRPPEAGAGIARAAGAANEGLGRHERAREDAERREDAFIRTPEHQATLVKLLSTQYARGPDGRPMIQMKFRNGARRPVSGLGVRVTYLNGNSAIAQDPNCGGPMSIPVGQTVVLWCPAYAVQGATKFNVEITGVEFAR